MIEIPTLKELQKIFFPNGIEGKVENKTWGSSDLEDAKEILTTMQSAFKCDNCGNCCKECSKHGILLNRDEYDKICNHLNLSHKEFKNKYKLQFKKRGILLQGDNCPFYNIKEKKCDIYELRPNVCKEYPFTCGSNIKMIKGNICFIPSSFCYPYLLGLYFVFEPKFKEQFLEKLNELPEKQRIEIIKELKNIKK